MYAVYVPHITEYIYQEFFRRHEGEKSIHLTRWVHGGQTDGDYILFGEHLKDAVYEMRKFKSEKNLSMRSDMDVLEIKTERRFTKWFEQTEKDIRACSRAAELKYIYTDGE